jgi:integrase
MARQNRYKIRPRKNAQGAVTSYTLDFGVDPSTGKRKQLSYPTRMEAENARAQYSVERTNFGTGANILTPGQNYDAAKALEVLSPWGCTLTEAANFLAAHRQEAARSRPVAVVVDEYLRTKEKEVGREYRIALSSTLKRFAHEKTGFGPRPISDLHGQEILDWIAGLGVANRSQKDYRMHIGGLILFAKRRNYLRVNPLEDFPWPKIVRKRPVCLSVDEVEALLGCADGVLVPILALGVFAGLRPEAEALKLEWQDIDWQKFEICIRKSKNEISHRIISFRDFATPLIAWVAPYAQATGRIYPYRSSASYNIRLVRARHFAAQRLKSVGIDAPHLTDWPQDVARHCFATYHSTHFGDVSRTADLLGHGFSSKMLRIHYRGLVSPSETPRYWTLRPTKALPGLGGYHWSRSRKKA